MEGNANKYVTGFKFASLLYTGNRCTKYTKICSEFFLWWHCTSEANRAIYKKIIMTGEAKSGKTIYMDWFVEWMIKDVRAGVGKFYFIGTNKTKHWRDKVLFSICSKNLQVSSRMRRVLLRMETWHLVAYSEKCFITL